MSVSEFLKEADKRIAEIFRSAPKEIEDLKNKPRKMETQQNFTVIMYAYCRFLFFCNHLIGHRRLVKNGTVSVENMKLVTEEALKQIAVHCDIYGLKETKELEEKAARIMKSVRSAEEYFAILDRLIIYHNKMSAGGWLDYLVNWPRLGYLYDLGLIVPRP